MALHASQLNTAPTPAKHKSAEVGADVLAENGTHMTLPDDNTVYYRLPKAQDQDNLLNCHATPHAPAMQDMIRATCDVLKRSILAASGVEPRRVFSRGEPLEQLRGKVDDTFPLIAHAPRDEARWVLGGYLSLRKGAHARQAARRA